MHVPKPQDMTLWACKNTPYIYVTLRPSSSITFSVAIFYMCVFSLSVTLFLSLSFPFFLLRRSISHSGIIGSSRCHVMRSGDMHRFHKISQIRINQSGLCSFWVLILEFPIPAEIWWFHIWERNSMFCRIFWRFGGTWYLAWKILDTCHGQFFCFDLSHFSYVIWGQYNIWPPGGYVIWLEDILGGVPVDGA